MKVKDVDKGARALAKRVYGIRKPKISVGILAGEGQKKGEKGALTVIEYATINEFGLGVPERSFIRAWFDSNEDRALKILAAAMQQVVKGKYSPEVALHRIAQKFVAEIKQRIANGIPPPNAPSTIRKKGSATPLIDEGLLRSSINYFVELDGKASTKVDQIAGSSKWRKPKMRKKRKKKTKAAKADKS